MYLDTISGAEKKLYVGTCFVEIRYDNVDTRRCTIVDSKMFCSIFVYACMLLFSVCLFFFLSLFFLGCWDGTCRLTRVWIQVAWMNAEIRLYIRYIVRVIKEDERENFMMRGVLIVIRGRYDGRSSELSTKEWKMSFAPRAASLARHVLSRMTKDDVKLSVVEMGIEKPLSLLVAWKSFYYLFVESGGCFLKEHFECVILAKSKFESRLANTLKVKKFSS